MSSAKTAKKLSGPYPQKVDLQDGNAMGAISGMHIDFDVVGYYPITPSTQVGTSISQALRVYASVPQRAERGFSMPHPPTVCSMPWSSSRSRQEAVSPWSWTLPAGRFPAP